MRHNDGKMGGVANANKANNIKMPKIKHANAQKLHTANTMKLANTADGEINQGKEEGVNDSTLLEIGDISVPELRRKLLKRRQEILQKNRYYVQQKVHIL